ncbi:hypothetical protein Tco_1504374 [Tanacetum coccineum]
MTNQLKKNQVKLTWKPKLKGICSYHQASLSAPLLSLPIIDLTPPKPSSPPVQELIFIATTTTLLPPPPPPQQQIIIDPELAKYVSALEEIYANLVKKNKLQEAVHNTHQAPIHERFRDLSEFEMKEILHDRMFESGSYKSHPEHITLYEALEASMDRENREEFNKEMAKSCKRCRDDQDPPPPPKKDSNQSKKKRYDSDTSASKQPPAQMSSTWKTSDTRDAPSSSSKQKPDSNLKKKRRKLQNQTGQIGKSKLSKADLEGAAFKVVKPFHKNNISLQFHMEECHLLLTDQIDLDNPEGNWVVPDVSKPLPLGGPPGKVTIQPQYLFNKDLEYLVSGDKERRNALSISKLKAAYYPDFGLEELVSSLWIKSERKYDISAAYGISHWWFKRKESYITRHSAPSNRHAVRSHMWILSVDASDFHFKEDYIIVCKPKAVIYRDGNNQKKMTRETEVHKFSDGMLIRILEKIDHRVKDYVLFKFNPGMEQRIWSEDDKRRSKEFIEVIERRLKIRRIFKNLESFVSGRASLTTYRVLANWDASDFHFKEDYTIVHKPKAVIYRDGNNPKKMMRETEVHNFSDGTLIRILEKLDHRVKDYVLFKFNPGMEHRIWSEDDKRRSKEFIEVIERRLKIRRIFKNLESFVSGRVRDIDYRLIQRTE